jgi:DNA-binding protein YbaB
MTDDLDPERLERVARAAVEAMEVVAAEAARLATVEVDGHSQDRRVRVRVKPSGRIVHLRLRDGVLQRYDSSALSELVTRTIRDTQRRAREAYEQAVNALTPPEVAENDRELDRIWRER